MTIYSSTSGHLNNIHVIRTGENEYINAPLMDFGKSFKSDYSKPFKMTHSEQIKLIPQDIKLFDMIKYNELNVPKKLYDFLKSRYEKYLKPFMR